MILTIGKDKGMASLGPDLTWTSTIPGWPESKLNQLTEAILNTASAADGQPILVVFNRVVEIVQPSSVYNNYTPPKYPDGAVF